MSPGQPIYSLFTEEQWAHELGRDLNERERSELQWPAGEGVMIAQIAAAMYPITLISPHVPGTRDWPGPQSYFFGWFKAGEEHRYYVRMGGHHYWVQGYWFDGHGTFAVDKAKWRSDSDERNTRHPTTGLKRKILAAAIEQRAAAIIAQIDWFGDILVLPEARRHAALRELMDEGTNFVKVEVSIVGDHGTARVNFYGLAGLGVYQFNWHKIYGKPVVREVYYPGHFGYTRRSPAKDVPAEPRRLLSIDRLDDRVIIEMVTLAMARLWGDVEA